MEVGLARYRLRAGLKVLADRRPKVQKREKYLRGEHDKPFAPEGVNAEYQDLQDQAIAPYFGIAVNAPVQRLRAEGIKTGLGESQDKEIWTGAWKANKLDQRQTLLYRSMLLHSRGIASCWPNRDDLSRPIVRPESFDLVHVEMDPDDPFTPLWAIKAWTITRPVGRGNGLILPAGVTVNVDGETVDVAVLYDDDTFLRFEKRKEDADYALVAEGTHPMRRPPFALYDYKTDEQGVPWSTMDALIPQQDAINTIRFNTLLAMQFSAFRQRIITGFDPRATDKDGNFLYQLEADGVTPKVDAHGNAIPVLNTPGRAGVDRILAFPGGDTKVFDLAESNLSNYVEVLNAFLVQFFSTGQIPPQYLLNQMANLSGDALAGAESTLSSLVQELQLGASAGHESLMELAWHAMGHEEPFSPSVETRWADAEARSFAQVIDAIVKLISTGFPKKDAWEMIPGTTPERLDQWMDDYLEEQDRAQIALAMRPLVDVTGTAQQVTPPAPPAGGQAAIEEATGAAGVGG
jgi:hypothetical protein